MIIVIIIIVIIINIIIIIIIILSLGLCKSGKMREEKYNQYHRNTIIREYYEKLY